MRTSVSAADRISYIRAAMIFTEGTDARDGKPQAVNTAEAVRKSESKSVDSAAVAENVRRLARLERAARRKRPIGLKSEGSVGWRLCSGTEQLTAVRHYFGCSRGASLRGRFSLSSVSSAELAATLYAAQRTTESG